MIYIILLFIFVFIYCYLIGRKNSVQSNNYTYYIAYSIPLIAISIILGLRFGWYTDYMGYYESYVNSEGNHEFLFELLNNILRFQKIPGPGAFVVYAFICYLGIIIFLSKFKDIAYLCFPLILYIYFVDTSNLIRYTLAGFFIYISTKILLDKVKTKTKTIRKTFLFILLSLCAILTHTGMIIIIPLILLCYKGKVLSNTKYTIPLFILSVFLTPDLFTGSTMTFINIISKHINFGDLSIERYLSDGNEQSKYFQEIRYETFWGREDAHIYAQLIEMFLLLLIIYCGNFVNRYLQSEKYELCYRIATLSSILYIPFFGNEIMMRVVSFLFVFTAFPIAYSLKLLTKIKSKTFQICTIALISCFVYMEIYFVLWHRLFKSFNIIFVWDLIK